MFSLCKYKWCFHWMSCHVKVLPFDILQEPVLVTWTFEVIVHEFDKFSPSMEKGLVLQPMVCSVLIQGFLIARTADIWSADIWRLSRLFFLCISQVQTQPNKIFYFHHSCHWSDTPVAKIYQRNAVLRVTANFPGDVLARAITERPAAPSQSCVGTLGLTVI